MKLRNFILINVVIAGLFGISIIFVPDMVLSLYGATLPPAGIYVAQLLGITLFSWAIIFWLIRDAGPSDARRSLLLANMIGDGLSAIVSFIIMINGVLNPLGWVNVILYLGLSLGFAYFYSKPNAS